MNLGPKYWKSSVNGRGDGGVLSGDHRGQGNAENSVNAVDWRRRVVRKRRYRGEAGVCAVEKERERERNGNGCGAAGDSDRTADERVREISKGERREERMGEMMVGVFRVFHG